MKTLEGIEWLAETQYVRYGIIQSLHLLYYIHLPDSGHMTDEMVLEHYDFTASLIRKHRPVSILISSKHKGYITNVRLQEAVINKYGTAGTEVGTKRIAVVDTDVFIEKLAVEEIIYDVKERKDIKLKVKNFDDELSAFEWLTSPL